MSYPVLSDFPSSYAQARGLISLRPFGGVAGSVRYLELLVAGRTDAFPALFEVSEGLSVAAGVSLEVGFAWLTEDVLSGWGVSVDQVVSDVVSDLGDLEVDIRQVDEGVFIVHGDEFAGAVWVRGQLVSGFEVAGAPVAWSLGDGGIVVTGDGDERGFEVAVAALTGRLESGVDIETLVPYRLVGGRWEPWVWPGGLGEALEVAEGLFASHWYERQRGPLGEFYQQQGREVNVVEYMLMSAPDGSTVSACACVVGIPNLIPQVDTVLVVDPDGSAEPFAFSDFHDRVEGGLVDVGVSPPRWLVEEGTV